MSTEVLDRAALTEILGASLTEEQAREIFRQGEEAVVFSLLTLARKLAALQPTKPAPTTPSGMIPAYQKPPAQSGENVPAAKPDIPAVGVRRRSGSTSGRSIACPVARFAGDGCDDAPIRAPAISRTSREGSGRS